MKKEKYAALTQNIEIHHYISQTVATTPHYSSGIINRKRTITTTTTCCFPTISSDPDRAVFAYIIFMPIIKRKTEKERKDG
jgi:hypothetical protein